MLVMHHGTSDRGADWIDLGYVDALKADRQLILLDSRGYGQSDKPHDPTAYDLALRTFDVIAVLDDPGIQKADYFGYRWAVGSDLVARNICRTVFGHSTLVGRIPTPKICSHSATARRATTKRAAMVDQVFGSRLTSVARTRLLANDLYALRALTQDRSSSADVLPSMTMPCLLICGRTGSAPRAGAAMRVRASGRDRFQFAGVRSRRYIVAQQTCDTLSETFLAKVHG